MHADTRARFANIHCVTDERKNKKDIAEITGDHCRKSQEQMSRKYSSCMNHQLLYNYVYPISTRTAFYLAVANRNGLVRLIRYVVA